MSRWAPEDAERYLRSLELFGMRFGLDRMRRLMTALGSPERRFDAIHVVGTNGKSSTARMIAAILQRHGLRTGAYLSPHLLSFAERVRIGDADLVPERFAAAVQRAAHGAEMVDRTLPEGDRVTQFEALTAAAYGELAAADVEVAVVEAGLGGRYDATSVIDAGVAVLTNVGLDHTRWLGPTIADVAGEKLAVVRDGATLVVGAGLHPDAQAGAHAVARRRGARLVCAPADAGARVAAPGRFQRRNFALAVAAAEAFLAPGRALDEAAVRAAAAEVRVAGRLELVDERPLTILDGAHNAEGIAALVESLPDVAGERPVIAVVSISDDKDAAGMLGALLPRCAGLVACASSSRRALPPATLASLAGQVADVPVELEPDPRRALRSARAAAGPDGAVLATGSIYLIGDLLRARARERASAR